MTPPKALIKRAADLFDTKLDTDLAGGVVPISKAASSVAALLKRSKANEQPIIITQKGYPTGVFLAVTLWEEIKDVLAELADLGEEQPEERPEELLVKAMPNGVEA